MEAMRAGGCACGTIRFEARDAPVAIAICHCSMCRRAAGAPVVAWALFDQADFAFVRGEPGRRASSAGVERTFCRDCGTQLTFAADFMSGLVDVTVASFDDPDAFPPQMHIWHDDRLSWLALGDALPRHAAEPPRS